LEGVGYRINEQIFNRPAISKRFSQITTQDIGEPTAVLNMNRLFEPVLLAKHFDDLGIHLPLPLRLQVHIQWVTRRKLHDKECGRDNPK
jgi:hypothetical protein